GEIEIEKTEKLDEDSLLGAAIEAGPDDLDSTNESAVFVYCQPHSLESVRNGLVKAGYNVSSAQVTMSPKSTVEVTSADSAKLLLRLLDTLE
ncbi:YebC/PmpR family DNA-binding transcriptional regulator, partial [Acinetobacter baumannii]